MTSCVLSNFMYDIPWLFTTYPILQRIPITLLHGHDNISEIKTSCLAQNRNCHVYKPPLPIPYGTHHSKFMVKQNNNEKIARCNMHSHV